MQIVANTAPLVVRFRKAGTSYDAVVRDSQDGQESAGPFEEVTLDLGEVLNLDDDATLIGVGVLGQNPVADGEGDSTQGGDSSGS